MLSRDVRVDNAKGALILLVIFGHLIEPHTSSSILFSDVYDFIYLFHMPAFIFLSGYLSGSTSPVNYSSLLRRIVIPFVIFSIIYESIEYARSGTISGYLHGISPNWILWFLVSVLCWRLITPLVMQLRFALIITIAVSVLFSLSSVNGYMYGMSRTVVFFPFYILGVMFNPISEKVRNIDVKTIYSLIAALLLALMYLLDLPFGRSFLWGAATFGSLGNAGIFLRIEYYIIASVAIVLFLLAVAKINVFGRVGRNSLHAYLWHGMIVKFVLWPYIIAKVDGWLLVLIAAVISLFLGYVLTSQPIAQGTDRMINAVANLILRSNSLPNSNHRGITPEK
ncbi:acyltransferase family protein [Citrobacter portucalensis]|uniref:acyltransferase family protein n=1 Tax=Citrobacter portucalensis TaxID=1639133 RepID=UPI00207CA185|nr:acyltransferase family protein [Citrobacter portucalensis]MCO4137709.1 acyltransferase family protein [Citrobacter portucalensis]MCO4155276.1 acyltransferase family protein [Citrobacter portucalensis]